MSKEKHKKTNALRILDTHHIAYTIDEYEWSEERGQGVHVADELGLDEKEVFKTLVGKGDKTGYVVFCIPVAEELDMKQAARVSGNKSVELIHVNETMQAQEAVYVSAGLRGMQMHVNPQDLQSVVNAEFVPLTMKH